jgi:hypothetical protein
MWGLLVEDVQLSYTSSIEAWLLGERIFALLSMKLGSTFSQFVSFD